MYIEDGSKKIISLNLCDQFYLIESLYLIYNTLLTVVKGFKKTIIKEVYIYFF